MPEMSFSYPIKNPPPPPPINFIGFQAKENISFFFQIRKNVWLRNSHSSRPMGMDVDKVLSKFAQRIKSTRLQSLDMVE